MTNDPVPEEFTLAVGKRLKQAMKARDVGTKELAAKARIGRNTVMAAARGERNLTAWALFKVCASLGVSADWLLGLKGGK